MIICLGQTPTVQRTMVFGHVTLDSVNRATEVVEYASGKSINCARVIHTLGHPVLCLGLVGGARGSFIEQDLDSIGVAHRFTSAVAATRLCTTVVDHAARNATELVQEAPPATPAEVMALLAELGTVIADAELLVLSGTLAPGSPHDFYGQCVRLAAGAGLRTIVDAAGPALLAAAEAGASVLKPNRDELARTLGVSTATDQDLAAAIDQLHQRGAKWVVLTDGPRGTLAASVEGRYRISTVPVQAVNAIGSGDAFAAGLAVALARGESLPEAAAYASAAGSANALTLRAGQVSAQQVQLLRKRVTVERA